MNEIDRRTLLCGGCAMLVAGCSDGSVPATLTPTGETGGTDPGTGTNPLDNPDYPCNQQIDPGAPGWEAWVLDNNPELKQVGGWKGFAVVGTQPAKFLIIAQVEEGCFVAVARQCTHEAVWVNYDPDRKQFVCPRHAALFDWRGNVVGGPAPKPLKVFTAGSDGAKVWVDVSDWVETT